MGILTIKIVRCSDITDTGHVCSTDTHIKIGWSKHFLQMRISWTFLWMRTSWTFPTFSFFHLSVSFSSTPLQLILTPPSLLSLLLLLLLLLLLQTKSGPAGQFPSSCSAAQLVTFNQAALCAAPQFPSDWLSDWLTYCKHCSVFTNSLHLTQHTW